MAMRPKQLFFVSCSQPTHFHRHLAEKSKTIHGHCVHSVPRTYIVDFKRLGSRHIHKGIKLQKAVNGIDMILCKKDITRILRHTYKCNTFSDVDFEVRLCTFVVCTISIKACFERGGFLLIM